MYAPYYQNIDFFKDRSKDFIAWICPLLRIQVFTPQATVYYEGDKIKDI